MVKMLGGEISSVSMSSSESEEELQEKKVKRKQSMMENEMEKQTSETGDEKPWRKNKLPKMRRWNR